MNRLVVFTKFNTNWTDSKCKKFHQSTTRLYVSIRKMPHFYCKLWEFALVFMTHVYVYACGLQTILCIFLINIGSLLQFCMMMSNGLYLYQKCNVFYTLNIPLFTSHSDKSHNISILHVFVLAVNSSKNENKILSFSYGS